MAELFRFRLVRPVQQQFSQALDAGGLIVTQPVPLAKPFNAGAVLEGEASQLGVSASRQDAAAFFQASGIFPPTWTYWLATFSSQLALQSDLVDPAACFALLPGDVQQQVTAASWATLQTQLADSLVSALMVQQPAAIVEALCRFLVVHDLVSTLVSDSSLTPGQRILKTASDVQAAVSWRSVTLPTYYFSRSANSLLARQPGITDLYVVHDEWNRYEPEELAQVINVLPGETFEHRIKQSQEVNTLVETTTTTTTTSQTEQDQTNSSSLSESTTKDASLNIGVQGQIQTSGSYGPTHVQTSLGAQLQSAQTSADTRASTTSFETVQRSLKSITQTVTATQATRTITRDLTYDDHKLENQGDSVTVGLYRWLVEIHRVQVERYPNRFVLEFEIPEPGAWLRWALQNAPTTTWDNPEPAPFRLPTSSQQLAPTDIDANTWTILAQQWRVKGLSPPPPANMTLSLKLSVDPVQQGSGAFAIATDDSLVVPTGYRADAWTAQVFAVRDWAASSYGTELEIAVGGPDAPQAGTGDQGNAPWAQGPLTGRVGSVNTGAIPVAVYAVALKGFTCVVNVQCSLMDEALVQWREATFDQLAAAYEALLSAHRRERDARNQDVSGQTDLVGPPELNQQRAVNEFRRFIIQDLLGEQFTGKPAIDVNSLTGEPSIDLQQAYDVGSTVQFFEQALEWENIVYICYPYYWARQSQWINDVTSTSADPVFDQFLNAGSARVVVPARPGFENLVNYFLYTGEIWGGSQPPAPNDPDYLSIAQEIQALEQGARDGTPVGSSWEIKMPTTLIWAGTDPSTLPTNPAPIIPAPTAS